MSDLHTLQGVLRADLTDLDGLVERFAADRVFIACPVAVGPDGVDLEVKQFVSTSAMNSLAKALTAPDGDVVSTALREICGGTNNVLGLLHRHGVSERSAKHVLIWLGLDPDRHPYPPVEG